VSFTKFGSITPYFADPFTLGTRKLGDARLRLRDSTRSRRKCRRGGGFATSEPVNEASASSSQWVTVINTASVIVGGGFGQGRNSVARLSVTRLSGCMASVFDWLGTMVIRSAFDGAVDRVEPYAVAADHLMSMPNSTYQVGPRLQGV
jgi:hypothetical protein